MFIWSLSKLDFIFYDFSVIYYDFFKYLAKININKKTKSFSKNFILKHIILYVHCVDILMWNPKKLDFVFYDFYVIYYDFLNIQQNN